MTDVKSKPLEEIALAGLLTTDNSFNDEIQATFFIVVQAIDEFFNGPRYFRI